MRKGTVMIRLMVCLLLVMASSGCAAEKPQVPPDNAPGAVPAATQASGENAKVSVPDIAPDHVVDDSGEYEDVKTPFGMMKRKINRKKFSTPSFGGREKVVKSSDSGGKPGEFPSVAPSALEEKSGDDDEYEVVNTPFGKWKRKKK